MMSCELVFTSSGRHRQENVHPSGIFSDVELRLVGRYLADVHMLASADIAGYCKV